MVRPRKPAIAGRARPGTGFATRPDNRIGRLSQSRQVCGALGALIAKGAPRGLAKAIIRDLTGIPRHGTFRRAVHRPHARRASGQSVDPAHSIHDLFRPTERRADLYGCPRLRRLKVLPRRSSFPTCRSRASAEFLCRESQSTASFHDRRERRQSNRRPGRYAH